MSKDKKEKKKIPFAVLSKKGLVGLAMTGIMVASPLLIAGCSDGKDGKDGAPGTIWKSGTDYTLFTDAKVGDYFIDTDDYILYQKGENDWTVVMQNYGRPGNTPAAPVVTIQNGFWCIDGTPTEHVAVAENGKTPFIHTDGYWYIGDLDHPTGIKAQGPQGNNGKSAFDLYKEANPEFEGTLQDWFDSLKGLPGENGISAYVGYDGYIWNGAERTEFKATNVTLGENVVENTIGIEGIMSKYFDGSYVDLKTNTIALMANYMPTIKATQYSGTIISKLKVVAKEAGDLYIGTAKVEDVVTARINGTTEYDVNMESYEVVAGVNTITVDLSVAEDETVVLGGNNSVSLYVAQGIPANDEDGNFALVDGVTHNDVISATNGVQDTLAVQVEAFAKEHYQIVQCLPDVVSDANKMQIADMAEYVPSAAPFTYKTKTYFAGKTITSVNFPLKEVSDHTKDQVLTIFVIKQSTTKNFDSNYVAKHELIIPANTFNSNIVNDWYCFDVSDKNFVVGNDETLAFFAPTDTVIPGYGNGEKDRGHGDKYYFYVNAGTEAKEDIYWDIKYKYTGEENQPEVEPGYIQLLSGVESDFNSFGFNASAIKKFATDSAPYTYKNKDIFSSHKLDKFGVPILELADYTQENKFTFYIIKKDKAAAGSYNQEGNYVSKHELVLPANTFDNNSVKQWYYFDISSMNITVGADETLAFFDPTDTVFPAYLNAAGNNEYQFLTGVGGGDAGTSTIYFDVQYYQASEDPDDGEETPETGYVIGDFKEHLEALKEKEAEAKAEAEEKAKIAALVEKLRGQNLSILGDSISTFEGYSNDGHNELPEGCTTNSTISGNAVYYSGSNCGITNVDQTWWKQIADKTEMNVLVNNSYSGDKVSLNGQTRCEQLHDNTGENTGTNPDIIAVYLGINDYNGGNVETGSFESINWDTLIVDNQDGTFTYGSASTFAEYYAIMLHKLTYKYNKEFYLNGASEPGATNAEIFLFTLVPNGSNSRPSSDLEAYNDIITKLADKFGCLVVDLYNDSGITNANKTTYMGDGNAALHPNQLGMDAITDCFWDALYEAYVTNAEN